MYKLVVHTFTPTTTDLANFLNRYKLFFAEIYRIYKKLYFQVVADLMCHTCSVPGWQRCVLCPRPDLLIPSETAAVWLSDKLAQFNLAQLGSRRCASRPHGLL